MRYDFLHLLSYSPQTFWECLRSLVGHVGQSIFSHICHIFGFWDIFIFSIIFRGFFVHFMTFGRIFEICIPKLQKMQFSDNDWLWEIYKTPLSTIIIALIFAIITTVYAKRSFSVNKYLFSDRRRVLTLENLEIELVSLIEL